MARSLVFCVMFCKSLFVLFLLAIPLSVLRVTASDYPFGIFKLLLNWPCGIPIILFPAATKRKLKIALNLSSYYNFLYIYICICLISTIDKKLSNLKTEHLKASPDIPKNSDLMAFSRSRNLMSILHFTNVVLLALWLFINVYCFL